MKGFSLQAWIGRFLLIIALNAILLYAPVSVSADNTVVVLKSSDNSFFRRTIDSIQQHTDSQVRFISKTLEEVQNDTTQLRQADLIISMGIAASQYADQNIVKTPVIHSYITEFQYLQFNNKARPDNHFSILLDQPLTRYLLFTKLLTGLDNIGLVRQLNNIIPDTAIDYYYSALKLRVNQEVYKSDDNPLNKIKNLLNNSDVLLSLPDPEIYNRQTLKGILLTTYRQNKPVISYSPSHVKSGALAAIFSSPENIGLQIADFMNKLLMDNSFQPEKFYYASGFDIKINQRVAKSMGLTLADKEQVLKQLKLVSAK